MPSARLTVAAVASWPCLWTQLTAVAFPPPSDSWPPGCFIWDHAYVGADIEESGLTDPYTRAAKVSSVPECQRLCQAVHGCAHFTYYPGPKTCYFESHGAQLLPAIPEHVVSGPAHCVDPSPACVGLPDSSWPGTDYSASMKAWPAGYQPMTAQCWARFANSSFVPCEDVEVLQDTIDGWPGKCNMMSPIFVQEPIQENCRQACYSHPECSGWQVNQVDQCFHGLGENCWSNPTWDRAEESQSPKAAQRIMHGSYRVLKSWNGVQILGLRQVFDSSNSEQIAEFGRDPAHECKKVCLSRIRCQYWQIDNESGCWIEDPADNCWIDDPSQPVQCTYNSHAAHVVPYPLTTKALRKYSNARQSEFLLRFCSSYRAGQAQAPPPRRVAPRLLPLPSAHGTYPSPHGAVGYRHYTASISTFPGYDAELKVHGVFQIDETAVRGSFLFTYSLLGLERQQVGGWHVHEGTDCTNPGAHYLSGSTSDPWRRMTWKSDVSGAASSSEGVAFELPLLGRTIVVHSSDGSRVGCGVIHASVATPVPTADVPVEEETMERRRLHMWVGYSLLIIGAGLGACSLCILFSNDDEESEIDGPSPKSRARRMNGKRGSPLLRVDMDKGEALAYEESADEWQAK